MTNEELLATVEECGDMEFDNADDANIPVGIFLQEIKDCDREHEEWPAENKWSLTADNFMPRRMRASGGAYQASAPTREALVAVVQTHIKPLYEAAMKNIDGMIEGTNDSLYYWTEPS